MTHRFTNCTFDLRGADYACVSRGDEFEIGYIGEGDRVLIDGDTLDFTGLHILGPVALADRIKAAVALECYALTTDRDALRAEIARLTAERDYDRKQSEHKSSVIDKLNATIASAAEKAEAERDAALVGGVKVKPLVWNTVERRYQMFQARSLGLVYEASCDPDMGWAWAQGDGLVDFVKAANEEAAKSAAQADYEARILAAIQPDTEARQAALAKAFCMGRDMSAAWCNDEADNCTDAAKWGGHRKYVADCKAASFALRNAWATIRALTPPADLAAKIGGEA